MEPDRPFRATYAATSDPAYPKRLLRAVHGGNFGNLSRPNLIPPARIAARTDGTLSPPLPLGAPALGAISVGVAGIAQQGVTGRFDAMGALERVRHPPVLRVPRVVARAVVVVAPVRITDRT
jgi:hypothetical protein